MRKQLVLRTACPMCKSYNVTILDKGLKRLVRLIVGNNRYLCKDCWITWKRQTPQKASSIKKKRKRSLPVRQDGKWDEIILPDGIWSQTIKNMNKTIDNLLIQGSKNIRVDVSHAQSLDSSVFGSFFRSYQKCKQAGVDLKIVNLPEETKKKFDHTSLDFLLEETEDHSVGFVEKETDQAENPEQKTGDTSNNQDAA